jgi:hypothetical protein
VKWKHVSVSHKETSDFATEFNECTSSLKAPFETTFSTTLQHIFFFMTTLNLRTETGYLTAARTQLLNGSDSLHDAEIIFIRGLA